MSPDPAVKQGRASYLVGKRKYLHKRKRELYDNQQCTSL